MIHLTFQLLLPRGDFFPQKLNYCYEIKGTSVNNRDAFKVHIFLSRVAIVITLPGHKNVATPLVVA
jgi:hypothetical protein